MKGKQSSEHRVKLLSLIQQSREWLAKGEITADEHKALMLTYTRRLANLNTKPQ